jgi:hypothetical protein
MKRPRSLREKRTGNIIVLTAFMLVGLMAMLAFSVDLGYVCVARQQLQRSADAAALAGCWKMLDEDATTGIADPGVVEANARHEADTFAALNQVLREAPELSDADIQVGYLANPFDASCPILSGGLEPANAVRVLARRDDGINGNVPLFFARVLGRESLALQAQATAVVLTDISGFRTPPGGGNLGMLPIALDEETALQMLAGNGDDGFQWDPVNEEVVAGSDGLAEVSLFPQGTGSPGNRGTVDIGSSNNSTRDIARQITGGISPQDLKHHGGELKLNDEGVLYLNGDTGISAGVKDELASIIGERRVIPVFREVRGNGNNATYTIVRFLGVRVLDVKLTGSMSQKRVTIQPARCVAHGVIPSAGGQQTSDYVYSTVWLAR